MLCTSAQLRGAWHRGLTELQWGHGTLGVKHFAYLFLQVSTVLLFHPLKHFCLWTFIAF